MATTTEKPRTDRPSSALSDDLLKKWLYDMQLIREFEVRTMQAYQQAKIGGFCHIYIGQEACAVGTIGCVEHDDPVVLAYRDHGHALARGMTPRACMAEMFGKITGCAKGKGGSMHMFDKPNHLYGGHGIVGAQTGLGAGLAFGARYEWEVMGVGKKRVCLCYLGDGALNQGVFHEAQNLAGLYNLPVIYIVENNGYSMGTAIERGTTMAHDLVLKAKGYGIKGIQIDGLDILNIYDAFKPFADECRDLQRPGFVDLKTYRYQGHSMSDPQKYRTKEEVESYKEKDSIAALAHHLMNDRKSLSEDDWKAMQKEIAEIVRDSVEFAEKSPTPDPETELASDVWVNIQPGLSPNTTYVHGEQNPLL
ncbi:MAG: pyruvate dehydrogenase (acetyl-transferring) E1 component subunit alpha [Phycisphaerales bacterium]|jgi:pyruvate dehydrogenase E1 component alpha subunit|nr:pyruvate dehydrogenase (acetyl-transferring) E1 component subunit alpha [Phycisphaerales bacterium]